MTRWSLGDYAPSEQEATWLIAYYQTVIEDISRTKKRQVESLYYSMLLYAGLYGVVDYFGRKAGTPDWLYIGVFLVSGIIFFATLVMLIRFNADLKRFRAISSRYHSQVFPKVVRAVRYGRSLDEESGMGSITPEPNKPFQDLPINLLMFVVPVSGPVFFGLVLSREVLDLFF